MARLLLVRHGMTEYNSIHRICGSTNIDMSETGYEQVKKVGERLAGEKIDAAYSSDLKRAVATAGAALNSHTIAINETPALREMNYGLAEGMTYQELKKTYPEIAGSIFNFHTGISFPEGETFLEFIERTTGFLDSLSEYGEEKTVLIASHGGVIKVLICHLLGIDQANWPKIRIDNASLSIVDTYDKRVILSLMNDTSHLDDPNKKEH